jgi:hypothetical protein
MTLSCVSVHHAFLLMLQMFSESGHAPNHTVMPLDTSNRCEILLTWLNLNVWAHVATNCSLSCLSCAESFWTTCNLYGFRHRLFRWILWTVTSGTLTTLAQEINFFRFCMKVWIISTTSSSHLLGRPAECPFPHSHYLKLLLPSPNALVMMRWSKFMLHSNNGFRFCVCAFRCMVDTILIAENM